MKKWCAVVAGCLVAVMTWADTTVKTVNAAGSVKISLNPGQLKLACVDIEGIGEPQTLQSLFGDEAVAAGNYANADHFILWDEAQAKYQRFAKYTNDHFYPCNTLQEWDEGFPTNPVVPVGEGFWIRCNPTTSNTFTITGQAVDDAQVQIDLVVGLQMIGYPYSAEIVLDGTDFANDGATSAANYANADQVIFWEGSGYQRYALYTDGKWYGCNTLQEWDDGSKPGSAKIIEVGEGFWYLADSAFEWTEAIPYDLD